MKIVVTSGIGEGKTKLSAFDMALSEAGIANYNLIPLSSVIPKGSEVVEGKFMGSENAYGYKLYVVIAHKEVDEAGKGCYAGLGWVQSKDGRGLFVEHNGETEEEVKEKIIKSLKDMINHRKEEFGKIKYKIVGTVCKDKPVAAVVCAVYKVESW